MTNSKKLIYTSCPLCNSDKISLSFKTKDHSISKEAFDIYNCSSCDFVFTQNVPLESQIGPYYKSEDYISHSNTTKGFTNKIYHLVRKIMLARKYKLIDRLNVGKDILDIGTGTGFFLNYMQNKNFKTLGVEVDADAREFGKKNFNLTIVPNSDLLNGDIKEPFSVISMWHVLEHIYDPHKYMQVINKQLKDNGRLVIAVPNPDSFDAKHYKSYWAGYDVPRHLWHFTPKTLQLLAEKNGFEVVEMKRLPFDSFYNSMLSEKYQNNTLSFIFGFFVGLLAYFDALGNVKKASSVIYILKKN